MSLFCFIIRQSHLVCVCFFCCFFFAPRPHPRPVSLYHCPSRSRPVNVGRVYLFYLGMSDSGVRSVASCNREILSEAKTPGLKSVRAEIGSSVFCMYFIQFQVSKPSFHWHSIPHLFNMFKADMCPGERRLHLSSTSTWFPHSIMINLKKSKVKLWPCKTETDIG